MTGAEILALESIRGVLFEIMVFGTNYEEVPYKDLDRPRYRHLKERLDATLWRVVKAVDGAGWAVVPIAPTQDQVCRAERAHGLLEGLKYEEGYRTMIEAGRLKPMTAYHALRYTILRSRQTAGG